MQVQIAYDPREPFIDFHARGQRWTVLVAHRRAGKTVACVNDLVAKALKCRKPNGFFAYVAPFMGQVEQIAWKYLKQAVERIPGAQVVETKKMVLVPSLHGTKATIRLFGADNPDALRGLYFDGIILDEVADMKKMVWSEVVRPALADRKGWAVFIGTPKGRNFFYELAEKAKASPGKWFYKILRASESGLLNEAEMQELREELDDETYQQEMECSFAAGIKGSYYGDIIAKMEAEGRLDPISYIKSAPVNVVFDLGWKDATACWFYQLVNGKLLVIDHQEWTYVDIHNIIKEIKERPYKWGDFWLPHDAKAHSLQTGKSMIEQFWKHGIKPRQVPELDELDGIGAVRLTLPRLWIDGQKCYQGIEALKAFSKRWNPELGVFGRKPKEDWTNHSADAMRYLVLTVTDQDIDASVRKRPEASRAVPGLRVEPLGRARSVNKPERLSPEELERKEREAFEKELLLLAGEFHGDGYERI